jgi:hypothetical protein
MIPLWAFFTCFAHGRVSAIVGFCVVAGFYLGLKLPVAFEYFVTRDARLLFEQVKAGDSDIDLVGAGALFAAMSRRTLPSWEDVISPFGQDRLTDEHVFLISALLIVFASAMGMMFVIERRRVDVQRSWEISSEAVDKVRMQAVLAMSCAALGSALLVAALVSSAGLYVFSSPLSRRVAFQGVSKLVWWCAAPIGLAVSLLLSSWYTKRLWRVAASPPRRCVKCGYDLRASADKACPECGVEASGQSGVVLWGSWHVPRRLILWVLVLMCMLGLGGFVSNMRGVRTLGAMYARVLASNFSSPTEQFGLLPLKRHTTLVLYFPSGSASYSYSFQDEEHVQIVATWRLPDGQVSASECATVSAVYLRQAGAFRPSTEASLLQSVAGLPAVSVQWIPLAVLPPNSAQNAGRGYAQVVFPLDEANAPLAIKTIADPQHCVGSLQP